MRAVYSFDMNVLRCYNSDGKVQCLPLTLGGRKLTRRELRIVAKRNWGKLDSFTYLKEGEGYL